MPLEIFIILAIPFWPRILAEGTTREKNKEIERG
jgi:hypothetical protein